MFERVLEKILLNVIGPYVDGIDKSNLKVGIWSGKAEVYNISVKPEVLSMFDLPLQMIFSSIGKLSLSVPWKHLGSKPVEIILEDVYIIVHPQDREKWEHADLHSASQKLKMMDSFAKNYSSKLSQKEEKSDGESNSKEQGIIAKLSEKAIDNVQVSIKNIHLRFEDPIAKKPYAFGITLDEILLHTTNEKWEITFVDRTQSENKLLPMRKKLLLKNFGVYWTAAAEPSEIFGDLVPSVMHKKMQQNILKNLSDKSIHDYIININAECKLTQKNRKDTKSKDEPEFDITFYLAPIHLSVKKKQLQDMIYLTSFLEEYKKSKFQALKEKEKQAEDFMSESQLFLQKDEFQALFKKILTKDQDALRNMMTVRGALDGPEQAQLFEELMLSMPDEEIATAMKQSLKEIEKEKRLRKLAEEKEEKGVGGGTVAFFKGLFKHEKKEKHDDDKSLWEKEDISRIEKYLDEESDDKEENLGQEEEGKAKNLLKFRFISEAGSAVLSNTLGNGSEQGITFQYTGLSCDFSMTSQSKKIDVDLNDFDLYLKTRYSSDKSFINTHIIRRVNYWLSPEKQAKVISLSYDDNPHGTYFKVKAQQVEVVYRKALIDRIKEFTDLLQGGQQVASKNEAFEIEESSTIQQTPETIKRRFFDVDIKAPVIVVPFLQNGDLKSECWVLNLGHFIMKTKEATTEEDQLYDKFELVLNKTKFQYYPTHALFNKLQKDQSEQHEDKMLFDLVENFNLKVKIRQFLSGSEKKPEAKELARLSVDVLIPTLDLQLRDDVYKKLLQISDIFDFSQESKDVEMAENERVRLMKGHDKLGTLYLREKKASTEWVKHFCVLNGSYLYFFKNADDQRPVLTFSLKNAKLQNVHDDKQHSSFCVRNDKTSIYVASESAKDKDAWANALLDKFDEFHSIQPNPFQRSMSLKKLKSQHHHDLEENNKINSSAPTDYESADLEVFFQIKDAKLTLLNLDGETQKKLLEIHAQNFETNYLKQLKKSGMNISMKSLEVKGFLSSSASDLKLISSMPPQQSELPKNADDLIDIKVFLLEHDHPKYHETQTNVQVALEFGYLHLNYKPQIINKLLQFISSSSENENPHAPIKKQKSVAGNHPPPNQENTSHTLLNLHINFKQLDLGFIHAESDVCLAELAFKNICLRYNQKMHLTELEARLGNVQLFDQRTELVGMQNQDDGNLLEINYKSYDGQHPQAQNQDNIFTFVDINMSNLQINYAHQIFMRLIDYVLDQLLPSLSSQESSNTVVSKEEAEELVKNPRFMDLNINAKSPVILLQPVHQKCQDHLEIRLGDLTVKTGVVKSSGRLPAVTQSVVEFIYCQKYDITMQNIGIWRVEGENRYHLTQKVSFNLGLEMPSFTSEYKTLLSSFDEKMSLQGRMTPMVIVLSNQDLLLIKKVLTFNILYDDGKSNTFEIKSLDKVDENKEEEKSASSSQYNINLIFENFSLLALSKEEDLPFVMINLHILQINVDQNDKNEMLGSVKAFEVNGSYFNKANESRLTERQMLGHLNRINNYTLTKKQNHTLIEEIVTSVKNYTHDLAQAFESKPETEKDVQFNFTFEFLPENKKIYKIGLTELKIYLVPDILSNLFELIQVSEQSNLEVTSSSESTSNDDQNSLFRVEVDLRNILVILPAFEPNVITDNPYLLVLRGDILCGYDSYAEPSLETVLKSLDSQQQIFRKMVDQCNVQNQNAQLKATLSQCELFICEFEDLIHTRNFSDVRKRNLILPLTLSYTSKTHFVPNRPRTKLVAVYKNELFIEPLVLRMSYQDALLVNNTLHFQLEKMNRGDSQERQAEAIRIQSNRSASEEFQEIQETDNWNVSINETHLYAQGIQILIINDANECLVPVFELTGQEVYGTVVSVKKKVSTILKFVINCSYFNPLPSKWEPIIEKFGLEMDIIQEKNPKFSILLSIDEDFDILNINISEEMILTLHSTFMTWKNDYEKKILKTSQTGVPRVSIFGYNNLEDHPEENELIDYISPYIIENQTGFPIEIETDHSLLNEDDRVKSKSKLLRSRSKKIKDLVGKTYKLADKQKTQYLVQSSIEDMFKQSLKETATPKNFIKVKIHHDKFNILPVTGVDIDRSYPTNYSLEVKTESGEDFFDKGFKLVYNVKIQNHTKIITFSSPFKIYNTTLKAYSLKLLNNSHIFETLLGPGKSFAVPLGFIDGQLDIKLEGAQNSMSKSFREFMDKPVQLFESQISGSHVVSLKSRKKDAETDFYEIFIQSPFMIKNCCGAELIYRVTQSADLDSDDILRLQPQETNFESSIGTSQNLFLQVRIPGFFWSEKTLVYSPNSKVHANNEITLTDISGNSLSLHIFAPQEQFTTKKFLIYTKACIINQTAYHLSYLLPGKQELIPVPGQTPTDADLDFNSNVTLTNEISRLVIAQDQENKSNVINIESADTAYVELWQKDQQPPLEMGLDISMMECDRDYKLYTRVIHINPRYVIVSKIDQEIQIKESGPEDIPLTLTLKKDERQSFQGSRKKILMKFKNSDSWSKEIDISSPHITNFRIPSYKCYVKATVTFQGSVLFVVFEEEKSETSELRIENSLPENVQIKVSQIDSSEMEIIKPGTVIPWGWELPSGKKQVYVEFVTEDGSEFKTDQLFDFSTFNQTQKVVVSGKASAELKHISATVTMEGHTKTLKFFNQAASSGRQGLQSPSRSITEETTFAQQKLITFNFEVNISGVGVSLISRLNNSKTLKKERREVLYLFLAGVQFKMLSSTENTTHQLRVKYFNLDNNTHFKTTFPVLLTPTKPKDLLEGENNYMIDFLISQKTNVEQTYFETVQFLLAETTLRADGMALDAVMQAFNSLSSALKNNEITDIQTITTAECLFSGSEEANKVRNLDNLDYRFSWQIQDLPEFTNKMFIQNLVLHPIFVNVSFQLKKAEILEFFFLGNLFATALGSAIVNLDDAPLRFRGFKIENLFGSQGDILNKILDKLKEDGAKCLLKVVGSLDILGNPTGLLENISTGVVELIERPRDGFLEGPLEGGKGIVKGAGVLMKNTVSGAFNSIGKITGSLASGLSNLTMDQEYQAHRERAKLQRPHHLGEGVYQGMHSVLQGLGYGVKGVIVKPYEGAMNEGMPGLVKGTMEGMTGLLVKPVTGVLDAASKTAEGVKNTATLFDQKPNHMRIRYPRAFYGKGKFYRSYVFSDAEMNWHLHNSKDMRFENISLLSTFDVFPNEDEKENFNIIALSYECVLCWSLAENKIIWTFNPKTIDKVELYQNGMQIQLHEPAEMLNENAVMLLNCDSLQNEFIGKKLIELKHI